jgi:hypothetical protein
MLAQEASDIYKRVLLARKEWAAVNIFVALCYFRLDYYDISADILKVCSIACLRTSCCADALFAIVCASGARSIRVRRMRCAATRPLMSRRDLCSTDC